MKNLGKHALEWLLCFTALVSLTGCGLQITIDIAPTATPMVLPTRTPATNEEMSIATAISSATPTGRYECHRNARGDCPDNTHCDGECYQPPTASPPPVPSGACRMSIKALTLRFA